MSFEQLKYQNKISKKTQLGRLAWVIVWAICVRPTPRFCLHGWRRQIYRMFGAKIGQGSKIDPTCRVWAPWNLEMGDFTALAEGVDCYCVNKITLGSKVAISQRAFLCTASHDISSLLRPLTHQPITVENHAWVCAQAMIYPGVTVGEGAVVAAGSIVTRSVSAWQVVGGNPAKFIKQRVLELGRGASGGA